MRRYYNLLLGAKQELVPPSLANLRIWTTSEQADTTVNNTDVTTLINLGTEGGSFTQGAASEKPKYMTGGLNGYPYIQPDGINDNISITIGSEFDPRMVFVVANYTDGATFGNFDGIFGSADVLGANYFFAGFSGATTLVSGNGATTFDEFVGNSITDDFAPLNVVKVFGYVFPSGTAAGDKTRWKLFQDRTEAGRFWGGDFYELLVYDVYDLDVKAEVLAYINEKYGI